MRSTRITACVANRLMVIGLMLITAIPLAGIALADPCGMVPPIYIQDNSSLVRVGDQQTYVFHKDGLETFVIRPGFSGKVEDFGMLIPFPTPPAIRKAPENIFAHVAAAIDPPEVVIDLRRKYVLDRLSPHIPDRSPRFGTRFALRH